MADTFNLLIVVMVTFPNDMNDEERETVIRRLQTYDLKGCAYDDARVAAQDPRVDIRTKVM